MKAIVGLGNVGDKYKATRHNVGFMLIDALSKKLDNKDIILLKPETMMNASGVAVSKLVNFYKINLNDLYLVHDDLDLRLGEYKLQFGVGPKVHNGVNSVEEKLRNDKFWRIRIGVDNREPENRLPGEAYVLQNFTDEEKKVIDKVFDEVTPVILERMK